MAQQPRHREVIKIARMVIMTVAAAGLIIGAGTATVDLDLVQVVIPKGAHDPVRCATHQATRPGQKLSCL